MDVRCFEEESNDTIIYCFCAGLETVKDAVVNPLVETPSTLYLRVQTRVFLRHFLLGHHLLTFLLLGGKTCRSPSG